MCQSSMPGSSVLVRVGQVGICGTDVKILAGKIPVDYPRIMGHEMVGEVVDAPPESPYQAGIRVLVDPGVACGWCHMCRVGRFNICVNGGLLGRDVDGVFTEYAVVPFNRLIPVPANISDKASGVLQVLGTCVHAVKTLDPFPGQVAAVIGLGVAGQLITQLLRLRGMTVVGITRSEWKRELATNTGTPSHGVARSGKLTCLARSVPVAARMSWSRRWAPRPLWPRPSSLSEPGAKCWSMARSPEVRPGSPTTSSITRNSPSTTPALRW